MKGLFHLIKASKGHFFMFKLESHSRVFKKGLMYCKQMQWEALIMPSVELRVKSVRSEWSHMPADCRLALWMECRWTADECRRIFDCIWDQCRVKVINCQEVSFQRQLSLNWMKYGILKDNYPTCRGHLRGCNRRMESRSIYMYFPAHMLSRWKTHTRTVQ